MRHLFPIFVALLFWGQVVHAAAEGNQPDVALLQRPASVYSVDDVITYVIEVRWHSDPADFRLQPPHMEIENLKFLGAQQRTKSNPESTSGDIHTRQVLTFSFKPISNGQAQIKHFELEWQTEDGTQSSGYAFPAAYFSIRKSWNVQLLLFIILPLLALSFIIVVYQKSRMRRRITPETDSAESEALKRLGIIDAEQFDDKEVYGNLERIFLRYLQKRVGLERGSLPDLKERLKSVYSKQELQQIQTIFQEIELARYAGTTTSKSRVARLQNEIKDLIKKYQVIGDNNQ